MKTLKFKPNLAEEILAGRKTVTWRLFDDKDLQIGDQLELINSETKAKFAEAEILKVKERKLGEVEEVDLIGHEKYNSPEEMLKTYKEYYGDKVDENTMVKIIEFEIL